MDVSATTETLALLRTQIATVIRNGGNPNHAADGKFTSGAGKPVPDVVVQPGETGGKYARLIARAERGEAMPMQCSHCSRMENGPYAGKRLGVVVRKDGWSHGACPQCAHDWLVDYYTRRQGMSRDMAERRAALTLAHEPIPDELLSDAEKAQQSSTTERAQRLRTLAAQLSVIQMQAAQVMRGDTEWTDAHGNVWMIERGAHGYFMGMYLVSAASGEGHATLSTGHRVAVGAKGLISVHEAARMLREKEGKPEEKEAGKPLEIKSGQDMREFNPLDNANPRNIDLMRQAFGDEQLGRVLHTYPLSVLREAADRYGLDTKGARNNKAALVTAIVAHVTRDEATGIPRYSADFGKSASGKTGGTTKFDAVHQESLHRAIQQAIGAYNQATTQEARAAAIEQARAATLAEAQYVRDHFFDPQSRSTVTDHELSMRGAALMQLYLSLHESRGLLKSEGDPRNAYNDPQLIWQFAGGNPDIFYHVIYPHYPTGYLGTMVEKGLIPGAPIDLNKTHGYGAAFAKVLTERMDRHFNGDRASWGRNAQATSATEHPFAAEYRARLAALRADAEKSGYHEANPAAKKAADALAKAISGGKDGKHGKAMGKTAQTVEPNYEPQLQKLSDPFDPQEAWEKLGGAEGLRAILPHEATGILETMLSHPNMPSGPRPTSSTKAALARTIIDRLQKYYDSGKTLPLVSATKTEAYQPQLQKLSDPFDPIEAFQRFGGIEGLRQVLPHEATGILEAMLRHPNMPSGPAPKSGTAKALANAILARLDRHFNGEQSSTAKTAHDDGLVVKRPVAGREINIAASPDARFLRELYGHDQLAKALSRYAIAKIREAADGIGVSHKGSKADVIARILAALNDEPETMYSQMHGQTPHEPSQRAIQPDLTPFARNLAAIVADLRRIA